MLEVDGSLVPLMRETGRQDLPNGQAVRTSSPVPAEELFAQSLTVHGTLDAGEPVTLPEAFTIGWTMRANGNHSHRLQTTHAMLGDHVDGADALFTRVCVRIRHLDAWANLTGFSIKPGSTPGSWTLSYEPAGFSSATMASGAQISLAPSTTWRTPTVLGGRLERSLWLQVLSVPPTTYRELDRKIVMPLMNLLSLAVGKECPLVEMMISTDSDHPWLTVRTASMKAAAEDIIPWPDILLPFAAIGIGGVAAWLDATAGLGPLPAVIARVATSEDNPLEIGLLELTSAAEGLHRLLRPRQRRMTKKQAREARAKAVEAIHDLDEDVRDAVEAALSHLTDPSYPRRLLDLADQVKKAVPGVTGNTQEWKKRVTNARNNLAHKLEKGFLEDDLDTQESVILMLSLRWLLTGLLLLRTGVRPTELGHRLSGHQPFHFFLRQAQSWLPAVYAASPDMD